MPTCAFAVLVHVLALEPCLR